MEELDLSSGIKFTFRIACLLSPFHRQGHDREVWEGSACGAFRRSRDLGTDVFRQGATSGVETI